MHDVIKLLSISWYFGFFGFAIGNWVSRLADIRDANHLTYTLMGSVLVLGAIGALVSLPIVSKLSKEYGSAKCLLFGGIWLCISIPPLGVGNIGLTILYPAMFSVGVAMGFTDVGMTSQAILYEKESHMNYMGLCQAFMSFGSFFGVIVGGVLAAFEVSIFIDFLIISLIGIPITLSTYSFLYDFEHEQQMEGQRLTIAAEVEPVEEEKTDSSILTISAPGEDAEVEADVDVDLSDTDKRERKHILIYLSIIGFCAQISEGTISDWSTLYFRDDLGASSGVLTVSGYAAFSLTMAIGR